MGTEALYARMVQASHWTYVLLGPAKVGGGSSGSLLSVRLCFEFRSLFGLLRAREDTIVEYWRV